MRPDWPPGRRQTETARSSPTGPLPKETTPPAHPGKGLSPLSVTGATNIALTLALSDERDLWLGRVLGSWREGYRTGYRRGYAAGLAEPPEAQDVDRPGPWPVPALGPLPPVDPQVDRRRYPPHGRKRFGEPRPGDYTGGPAAWNGRQHD